MLVQDGEALPTVYVLAERDQIEAGCWEDAASHLAQVNFPVAYEIFGVSREKPEVGTDTFT